MHIDQRSHAYLVRLHCRIEASPSSRHTHSIDFNRRGSSVHTCAYTCICICIQSNVCMEEIPIQEFLHSENFVKDDIASLDFLPPCRVGSSTPVERALRSSSQTWRSSAIATPTPQSASPGDQRGTQLEQ